MPIHLILYGTDGCHLCDQAYELLMPALAQERITVSHADILDDPVLEERYGIRIPVIQDAAGLRELGWPFDHDELENFLTQLQNR